MALGKTAFPIVTGAADRVGAVAGAGAAVASPPHWVLRKSFHFTPLSVPAVLAAWYLALHSRIESPWAVGVGSGAATGDGAGAAVASPPHWVLRKSFHFKPLSVPAFLAA